MVKGRFFDSLEALSTELDLYPSRNSGFWKSAHFFSDQSVTINSQRTSAWQLFNMTPVCNLFK